MIGFVEELPLGYDPRDPCNSRASSPEHVSRSLEARNRERMDHWRSRYTTEQAVNERLDHLRRHGAC